ncbi:MAG: hypothetical protein QM702_11930 [Rubrivivax sp.]
MRTNSVALRAWGVFAVAWAVIRWVEAPGQASGADISSWLHAAWPLAVWALAWAWSLPSRHPSALDIEALAWAQLDAEPPSRPRVGSVRRVERAALAPAALAPNREGLA